MAFAYKEAMEASADTIQIAMNLAFTDGYFPMD